MKQSVKAIILTASHLGVFTIGSLSLAGYLTQSELQVAAQDPLYRVGLALFVLTSDIEAAPSIDADLAALHGKFRAPTGDVIRLTALLHLGQLDEAAKVCTSLAWERCDAEALVEMQGALEP